MSISPDGELREVRELKRCTQGLARTIALCQRPGADTEETDVMI